MEKRHVFVPTEGETVFLGNAARLLYDCVARLLECVADPPPYKLLCKFL